MTASLERRGKWEGRTSAHSLGDEPPPPRPPVAHPLTPVLHGGATRRGRNGFVYLCCFLKWLGLGESLPPGASGTLSGGCHRHQSAQRLEVAHAFSQAPSPLQLLCLRLCRDVIRAPLAPRASCWEPGGGIQRPSQPVLGPSSHGTVQLRMSDQDGLQRPTDDGDAKGSKQPPGLAVCSWWS